MNNRLHFLGFGGRIQLWSPEAKDPLVGTIRVIQEGDYNYLKPEEVEKNCILMIFSSECFQTIINLFVFVLLRALSILGHNGISNS